jgi:hypothetical protein
MQLIISLQSLDSSISHCLKFGSVQQAHKSDSILAAVRPQDPACLTTFQQMEQAVSVSAFAGIYSDINLSTSRSCCQNTSAFCS